MPADAAQLALALKTNNPELLLDLLTVGLEAYALLKAALAAAEDGAFDTAIAAGETAAASAAVIIAVSPPPPPLPTSTLLMVCTPLGRP